ncbi:hypothetical protein [Mycobacterium spongiae]|uniref:hypothetical protein n=1 Tax=Mycobacterium spongiae TaxID=886343 RepID=UPI001BA4ED0B|nr:hypothetical protein [Mycobacterium spongiae]
MITTNAIGGGVAAAMPTAGIAHSARTAAPTAAGKHRVAAATTESVKIGTPP